MSDFKFRLATLLRLREATRDERRVALAESQRDEDTLRRQSQQLHVEWSSAVSTMREAASPGSVDIDRLVETRRYQETLELQRRRLNEEQAALAAEIERRREALLESDRDVRTLEKLRDAQKLRHRQEAHRQGIKRLDEATQLRVAIGSES